MKTDKRSDIRLRPVTAGDEEALVALENACFPTDRLSPRRIHHYIHAENRLFHVATIEDVVVGYCLVFLHRGTRLARLYSIAVADSARGLGIGKLLLQEAEEQASEQGRLYMRLEVAKSNQAAISLYQQFGYREFDLIEDYYENHEAALRMQKRIRYLPQNRLHRETPWYEQSTDFTCGPAALMMAMASLDKQYKPGLSDELAIWRESTTIFMTSGTGGCHPVGLGLAAANRGFRAQVWLNRQGPVFMDSVRNADKRRVMEKVDADYHQQARAAGVEVIFSDLNQEVISGHLNDGGALIMLISHYRFRGYKAPHWVTVTGMDDLCFYLHDPDCSEDDQADMDCQHVPVAREDFEKMTGYGRQRLRTAILLSAD